MGNKAKKLVVLTASLMLLLTALAACKTPDNNSGTGNSSDNGNSSGSGQSGKSTFALEDGRVELDTEEDLGLLIAFNDYANGGGEPTISLDTTIKKFGEASIKVENKANSKFTSDNSWPSVEVPFSKPQDFSTKKYTQFHVYSAESEPFVMDIQFSADGFTGFKSNVRQINPGWNIIEIANNKSRDFSVPADYSVITGFIFSTYGHATKDCVYYIDDIILTDETGMTDDVYNLVTLEYTSYTESNGSNLMVPYTMFSDSLPSMPTSVELTNDGQLLLTQYNDWHCFMFNAFNVGLSNYSVLSVDFENVDDKEVEVAIAAEGGDYTDGGPRIPPSAAMVRKKLQPGEKATLNLKIADIEAALINKDSSLTLDNLAYFHIFSIGDMGEYRTFAVTSMKVLTEAGIVKFAAMKVDEQIAKLPSVEDISPSDISAVQEARVAYNALSEEEKAFVANLGVLETLEAKVNVFTDEDYANDMEETINSIPSVEEITLEDAESIAVVRAKFDALTEAQQALVENYSVLTSAEEKIDQLVAKIVDELIVELPIPDSLTIEDRPAVVAVREAYDALTDSQKAFIENYSVLVAVEAKMAEIFGSTAVVSLIEELKTTGTLNGEDVTKIINARNAYEALTKNQKLEVSNLTALQMAEANMLSIKTFSSEADASDLTAGLYNTESGAKHSSGYVVEIGGKTGGFGWIGSAYAEGAVTSDDANSDGHINDGGWNFVKILPQHEKSAYQALLDAGYTTISFQIYQATEGGGYGFWSGIDSTRWGILSVNEWHTLEVPLEKLVSKYDLILAGGTVSMFGFDQTDDTKNVSSVLYISDVTINALYVQEPIDETSQAVVDAINALKQEGSFNGEDINAILAARTAYNALSDEAKAEVTNVDLLESAEAKMLSIKTFSSETDASNLTAGLYNTESAAKHSSGYVAEIGGKTGGFGWIGSAYAEGAVTSDDADSDGHINDGGWNFVKILPQHEKSAYQALLDAGYTTISFQIYQATEGGSYGFWSSLPDTRWGILSVNEWHTLEISLEKLVNNYDAIVAGGTYSLLGFDQTDDTKNVSSVLYISNITINALPVQEPVIETSQAVIDAINALKQEGSFNGEDINAILAARTAYNALSDEAKAEVTNVDLLESAEAKMLSIKTFSSETDASNLTAGLYNTESGAKHSSGYVVEIGGKTGGFGWIGSAYAEGAVTSDDANSDGHINDGGWNFVKILPQHEKSAYQALLDAGYTTISFQIYQATEGGGYGFWSSLPDTRWGILSVNEWHTLEISLEKLVNNYDAIVAGGTYSLLGFDQTDDTKNVSSVLYISDIVVVK